MKLHTTDVLIRELGPADTQALLDLRARNESFLRPFEPGRNDNFLTLGAQQREIMRAQDDRAHDRAYSFGVFLVESDELVGRVSLSNIVRATWQNATLGYFIGSEYNSRGYGTRAVRLAVEYAFVYARLHRVQAAVMPRNVASRRVLEKARFRHEGLSKRYLRINDRWEDHDIYAITAEEWEAHA
jgi:[ribosomal protein S5]-alanine N-acetyltransferase